MRNLIPVGLLVVAVACGGRAPVPGTSPQASEPPAFRLPAGVAPTAYTVELTVTPGEETYRGEVQIELALTAPASVIWLHAEKLDIQTARVDGAVARTVTAPPSWLGVRPAAPIGPGPAKLAIQFSGHVNRESGTGLFEGRLDGQTYLYTQLEPIFARQLLPCFDEPGFKVPWQLTLRVPAASVAASNMPVERDQTEGATRVVRFARTPPLPSYLLAFAVGPFDVVDGGVGGRGATPLRYLVPHGQAARVAYLRSMMPRIVAGLEDRIGVAFPFAKLDVVATVAPIWFHGAMENSGMIVSGMEFVLGDESANPQFRQSVVGLMTHEVAHQWFGGLVTPAWWDDIWLNESFADWLDQEVGNAIAPDLIREAHRTALWRRAVGADLEPTASAVRREIRGAYDINDAFDGISYAKGASILTMLEGWLGRDAMGRALRAYLSRHAKGTATAEDFFAALAQSSSIETRPMLTSFVDRPGIPRVSGQVVCEAGKPRLRMTQTRLQPVGSDAPAQLWAIPVCVRHGRAADRAGLSECLLLDAAARDVPLKGECPDWVVLNAGQRGYYLGDPIAELDVSRRDRLTPDELVAKLQELSALVFAGVVPLADALRATEPLLADASPDVHNAIAALDWAALKYADDRDLPALLAAIGRRHGPRARELGVGGPPDEPTEVTELRAAIGSLVGWHTVDPQLAAAAAEPTRRWLEGTYAMPTRDQYWVPATAARTGDAAFLAALRRALPRLSIVDAETVVSTISSLGDPGLMREGFRWALGDEVAPRLSINLLYAPPAPNRDLFRQLVAENLDTIITRTALADQRTIPLYLAYDLCDAPGRGWFEREVGGRVARLDGGADAYREALASVDRCLALREVHAPGLHAWLTGSGPKPARP